ncbi:MAG: trypsin-like peptidase domain-containing protein [Xanthobacteraceae bacterium]
MVPVTILKDGQPSGAGVHLESGLVVTAAHLTSPGSKMGVRVAGVSLPAKLVKQGSFQDVDLSLLLVDPQKLPAPVQRIQMGLCKAPPWPGDPVIVVDGQNATRSRIVSPDVLAPGLRSKFSTLIADVATTGNSGSGVFDPNGKCLLGIMSGKFTAQTPRGGKYIAKYFVPALTIREFLRE